MMIFRPRGVVEEEEVIAVGKKNRPAMRLLARRKMRQDLRCAASGGDAAERTARAEVEDDGAVRAPGATVRHRGIADDLRRSSGGRNALELPAGKKADGVAVGRP